MHSRPTVSAALAIARAASAALGVALALAAPTARADEAVSEPHAVLRFGADFLGFAHYDRQAFTGGGTYYWPVAREVGVAAGADVGFASGNGDVREALGARGAVFWRRPEEGFGGALVRYFHYGTLDRVEASAIGGLYLGDVDLLASAGFEGGDGGELGLGSLEVGWYATPQVRLGAGLEAGSGPTVAAVGDLYFQPGRESPVALRIYAGGGERDDDGFYTAGVGLVVTFAQDKPLLRQLRADRLLHFD